MNKFIPLVLIILSLLFLTTCKVKTVVNNTVYNDVLCGVFADYLDFENILSKMRIDDRDTLFFFTK